MKINTMTTVDYDLKNLAQKHSISYSEAIELGLKILLADRSILDYPDCKLYRKLQNSIKILESNVEPEPTPKETIQTPEEIEKEIDEVFKF